jgi:hypothetical protein
MAHISMDAFGGADFTELFRPKPVGERINAHVVPAVPEPKPDYAAMQRLIESGEKLATDEPPQQGEPKK